MSTEAPKLILAVALGVILGAFLRESYHMNTEIHRLEQENKELREREEKLTDVICDLIADLETYIDQEYQSRDSYPDIMRRYNRDMAPVAYAKHLLNIDNSDERLKKKV